jgi:hypothetical protein
MGFKHGDNSAQIERAWLKYNTGITLLHNGFEIFTVHIKIVFAVHLKHSRFWSSPNIKHM